ncbi:hypothetical protein BsWGS_23266 [Bradybaena similaris]
MTFLLYVVSIAVVVSMATGEESLGKARPRHKRNLIQMCGFMRHYTGRRCLSYNKYGCYCGFRTSTVTPVDEVDGCCRQHDVCYQTLKQWCTWRPMFITYGKSCGSSGCTCTDSPTRKPCDYNTCQCDLSFAQCLQTAGYNQRFRRYNTNNC